MCKCAYIMAGGLLFLRIQLYKITVIYVIDLSPEI